ncbi:MAG: methionine adenosyltransferase [Rhodospirillales bacterium]|nr:methionine adenosyltransferase [Rhodospirillales bacterium]MCY3857194.1 methionine adenosyltransferase [Rhodospirillales bacterium]MCY4098197.1 methionine adenosyltransferase [Rhodospirillales bacterium]MXX23067.1 methionine adenosyltransferase [Rhodospirillales bacterium]MYE19012.1 methionine adenosyltransferase [Rhodospirillales bacterium]
MPSHLFTSESVSEGHPDKICDQISDTLVDLILERAEDPRAARAACEAVTTTNLVLVAGEIRGLTLPVAEVESAVRQTVRTIGYEQESFHWQHFEFDYRLHGQSSDIAQGVDAAAQTDEGAGDQGLMFGYACRETEDALMPAALHYSNQILLHLRDARRAGTVDGLGPDAKSQVTLRYEDGRPVGVEKVVVSSQHEASLSLAAVRDRIIPSIETVLPQGWMPPAASVLVNPTGKFVIGGPDADAGLTGRKIIVDTYGGACPHGGGAFSGKDASKVDRSAAYAARYLAKNIVAAGLADACTIQVAYAIGVADPVSIRVQTDQGPERDAALTRVLDEGAVFSLRPGDIREQLGLYRPIYRRTAAYGHFGRAPELDGGFSWEQTDRVDALRDAVS